MGMEQMYFAVDMANGFTYVGRMTRRDDVPKDLEDVIVMETASGVLFSPRGDVVGPKHRKAHYSNVYIKLAKEYKSLGSFERVQGIFNNTNVVSLLYLGDDLLKPAQG